MTQALTEWPGDVPSLLAEMKRLAGVRTDQELAEYMGVAQSTVANWRKRGAIPQSAVLRYEKAISAPPLRELKRTMAATAVALRLPELWYDRLRSQGGAAGRWIPYSAVALTLNSIVIEIASQIARLEAKHGLSTDQLLPMLLEDVGFLNGVVDWVENVSMSDALDREAVIAKGQRDRLTNALRKTATDGRKARKSG